MAAAEMKTLASLPRRSPVIGRVQLWAGRWLMGNDVTRPRERESKITRPDLHTCSLSFRLLPVTMETPVGLFSGELRCWLNQEHARPAVMHQASREDWEVWLGRLGGLTGRALYLWEPVLGRPGKRWEVWECFYRSMMQRLRTKPEDAEDISYAPRTRECTLKPNKGSIQN